MSKLETLALAVFAFLVFLGVFYAKERLIDAPARQQEVEAE